MATTIPEIVTSAVEPSPLARCGWHAAAADLREYFDGLVEAAGADEPSGHLFSAPTTAAITPTSSSSTSTKGLERLRPRSTLRACPAHLPA
jgi:hypothetical protein